MIQEKKDPEQASIQVSSNMTGHKKSSFFTRLTEWYFNHFALIRCQPALLEWHSSLECCVSLATT